MGRFLPILVFSLGFLIKGSTVLAAEAVKTTETKTNVTSTTAAPIVNPILSKSIIKTIAPTPSEAKVQRSETVEPKITQGKETDFKESDFEEADTIETAPKVTTTKITPSKPIEEPPAEMHIENNITFGQAPMAAPVASPVTTEATAHAVTPVDSNSNSELKASVTKPSTTAGLSLIPMVGTTAYQGNWNNHITNSYSLGIALELSLIPLLSLEIEAGHGRYYISYSSYGHHFNQYTYGGTAKFYINRGIVQTYIGGGVLGISYQNMTRGMSSFSTYDYTVGAGQIIGGADIALSNNVSIGIRGGYIVPLFNRPRVISTTTYAYPEFEEAAAMDTAMYRLMGAVKISF